MAVLKYGIAIVRGATVNSASIGTVWALTKVPTQDIATAIAILPQRLPQRLPLFHLHPGRTHIAKDRIGIIRGQDEHTEHVAYFATTELHQNSATRRSAPPRCWHLAPFGFLRGSPSLPRAKHSYRIPHAHRTASRRRGSHHRRSTDGRRNGQLVLLCKGEIEATQQYQRSNLDRQWQQVRLDFGEE